ncbi:MAG: efflux transporter outer membrane subunit [Methylovulum sp.]|nr:efflux transporter outer membrane subunit [Methylovulum sp.]
MIRHQPAFIAALLLSGCTVGPDYQRPNIAAPKQWHAAPTAASIAQADKWWQTFNDPTLNRLITDAIAANLDLKQALIRIKDARAQRVAIFAAALPSVSAKSTISRRLNNTSASSQSGGAGAGFGVGSQLIDIFQNGFDAQWELDFFGGARRAAENADAQLAGEIESSRDVLVTLLGDVASNYIALRANQRLQQVIRDNQRVQQETHKLTVIRQQSGLANSLDVTQAQAQLAATEAQLPVYQRDAQLASHALSVLLGMEPGALAARLGQDGPLPSADHLIIPGLPSELLQRRPDIRRAERDIAAASAAIGVATAELYPKINLSAFLGLQNTKVTDVTLLGKSWSSAASITMPVFNWGRLKANINSKLAQADGAVLAYQATVLTAFKEVEDALVSIQQEQARHQALAQAVAANRLAVSLADERYQKGLTGFIDVLQSQQALYQTELTLIDSAAIQSTKLVALYKALGGGWQTEAGVGGECGDCKKNLAEYVHDATKALSYPTP